MQTYTKSCCWVAADWNSIYTQIKGHILTSYGPYLTFFLSPSLDLWPHTTPHSQFIFV